MTGKAVTLLVGKSADIKLRTYVRADKKPLYLGDHVDTAIDSLELRVNPDWHKHLRVVDAGAGRGCWRGQPENRFS